MNPVYILQPHRHLLPDCLTLMQDSLALLLRLITCCRLCLPLSNLPRLIPGKLTCLPSPTLRFSAAYLDTVLAVAAWWKLSTSTLHSEFSIQPPCDFLVIRDSRCDSSLAAVSMPCTCSPADIHLHKLIACCPQPVIVALSHLSCKCVGAKSSAHPAMILPDSVCQIGRSARDFVKRHFYYFHCALFLLSLIIKLHMPLFLVSCVLHLGPKTALYNNIVS